MADAQPDQIGPYVLTRRLNEGGMGVLYVGHLEGDENRREVAIKVVDPAYCDNRDYVAAFRREAETASRIDHPNIVQVFDRGCDQGSQFLVMELLHGRSLAEVFMRGRTEDRWMSPDLAVWAMARAAEGLHHVHETRDEDGSTLGMVHGDVSPQNIFLTTDGEVKIIDFGLAHSAIPTSGDDSPAKVYGKVHYLSPEQCSGKPFDHRADIWAVGATLYESLTTHSAFSAASKFLVMMRISQGQADSIRDHMPEIDPDLESIVERCLSFEQDERFEDAEGLRNSLDSYLSSRGVDIVNQHFAAYMKAIFGNEVDGAAGEPEDGPLRRMTGTKNEPQRRARLRPNAANPGGNRTTTRMENYWDRRPYNGLAPASR